MPLSVDKILQDESLDMISGYVGPFFSYPLTCRWLVGGKLLAGYVHYPSCRLSDIRIGDKNGFGSERACRSRSWPTTNSG